jgi:hypothetical protein
VVVAQHVAVVGEEQDQRVVVQAAFLESRQDSTDLLVDERD